ncbi:hypothetical protein FXO38_33923 [Capsicum annuum]|nr:hypothetical protein FXO38_33923 [Capsicum annuum]
MDDECVTNKMLSVSISLLTYEYIDSLPLVYNVNVVQVDTLVDPMDDRIDSSSKIDLCPPSVEAFVLNESTSSYENCVDQLVCKTCPPLENMCDVINESQVSEEFESIGQEKRSEPMSLCCCKDSNVCLAHRVNRVLDISLELDNDSLESESSKSVRGLYHSLFRYNVLFVDSLNTPNRPSGENDGITCLGSYSIYANPLWCDNIPPKDGNIFLEDESTLKGKECVILETTSSSTLYGFFEDTIVEIELSAIFLYSLFTCDDMYANVESRPCGYGKDYRKWELLRLSSRIDRDSNSVSFRDKARHLGLFKYLDRYLDAEKYISKTSQSNPVEPSQITENSKSGGKFYMSANRTIEAVDRRLVDGAEEPLRREKLYTENRGVTTRAEALAATGIPNYEGPKHPLAYYHKHNSYKCGRYNKDPEIFLANSSNKVIAKH